jgi:hypothetical protein
MRGEDLAEMSGFLGEIFGRLHDDYFIGIRGG